MAASILADGELGPNPSSKLNPVPVNVAILRDFCYRTEDEGREEVTKKIQRQSKKRQKGMFSRMRARVMSDASKLRSVPGWRLAAHVGACADLLAGK